MSVKDPQRYFRTIVESPKIRVKDRIEALELISDPPFAFLTRVIRKGTPKKLCFVAAKRLQEKITKRQQEQEEKELELERILN